jgi:hypothetical protein
VDLSEAKHINMNITKQDVEEFKDKKIRLITDNGHAYVGTILSCGEDYVKIRDKYDHTRFITFRSIEVLEEAKQWN